MFFRPFLSLCYRDECSPPFPRNRITSALSPMAVERGRKTYAEEEAAPGWAEVRSCWTIRRAKTPTINGHRSVSDLQTRRTGQAGE